jgi:hypothetical protein
VAAGPRRSRTPFGKSYGMRTKGALYVGFAVLLAPLLTGCLCSHAVLRNMEKGEYCDKFQPRAVYRRDSPNGFALDGTRQNREESFQAFLVIDQYLLEAVQLQTNQTLSVADLHQIYDRGSFPQATTRKAPRDYELLAVLPRNDLNIDVERHYPGSSWGFLLLPAFVADIATCPFQWIYLQFHSDS